MGNVVTYLGRKMRLNSASGRIEYFHENAGQWMDDGPIPDGATDLTVKHGQLSIKVDGVEYTRGEYGAFTPKKEKVKKEKESSGGGGGGNKVLSAIWWVIKLPFRLIWWIIKAALVVGVLGQNKK